MIKFVLILHLCSFLNLPPTCFKQQVVGVEYNDNFSCMLDGYKRSGRTLENIGREDVNTKKLAIKFQCKEVIVEQT